MSTDNTALIAAADTVSVQFIKDFPDATFRLIAEMRDALEAAQQENERIMDEWTRAEAELTAQAAQQTPAVDREALAKLLYNSAPEAGKQGFEWEDWSAYEEETQRTFVRDSYRKQADHIFASGIVEDSALIRSEGYDEGWNDAIHDFMIEGG